MIDRLLAAALVPAWTLSAGGWLAVVAAHAAYDRLRGRDS